MCGKGQYWQRVRQMIEHENELINHRLTWLMTSQSILFGAVAILWEKDKVAVQLLCIVGFLVVASFGYSLFLANRAMWNLVDDWDRYASDHQTGELPPIYGLKKEWPKWPYPWLFIPPVVAIAWFLLLLLAR